MNVQFETQRLTVRTLEATDEMLYCHLYGDLESMRFVGTPISLDSAARRFCRQLEARVAEPADFSCLVMLERSSGASIGICGLQSLDRVRRSVEAGMMLTSAARGWGIAREGLSALVDYAFRLFPVDEVWVQYPPEHLRAERLVVDVGFVPGGSVATEARFAEKCVWSIVRKCWCSTH
ncbi:MAG: GNAT family N-acetyltransferase [Tahibacter sp.]